MARNDLKSEPTESSYGKANRKLPFNQIIKLTYFINVCERKNIQWQNIQEWTELMCFHSY